MSSPTNPNTPESWDAASRSYADRVAPVMMQSFAAELVDRLEVAPDSEALEVGAGSGALTETLAPRVKSLLATDFSSKMIEILQDRMRDMGAANVTCEVMDGQALTVPSASFDRAASSFALMLFPDRAKGFSELRRALRTGGRAVVSGWAGPDKFEVFGLLLESIRTAFPDMPPPPAPPAVLSLADPAGFKAQMESAGFDQVEVEFVSRDLVIAGFDEMWTMMTTGAPPVQMLFDQVGPGGRERLGETLRGIVEKRFGSGPIRLTNTATVGSGVAH